MISWKRPSSHARRSGASSRKAEDVRTWAKHLVRGLVDVAGLGLDVGLVEQERRSRCGQVAAVEPGPDLGDVRAPRSGTLEELLHAALRPDLRPDLEPGVADLPVDRTGVPARCVSSANAPPGRSSRATLAQPTAGSTQWNAVAEKTESYAPAGSSTSSKRPRWKVTASPTDLRATSIIAGPGSTASRRNPRCASSRVNLPVPQPTSSTRAPSVRPAQARSTSAAG